MSKASSTEPAATGLPETVVVPRAYAERARSGYSWDMEHYARIYGLGFEDKIIGRYDRDGSPGVRDTVAAVRHLTGVLGGFKVGDYVLVPNAAIPTLYSVSPSDRFSQLKGEARVRVVKSSGEKIESSAPDPIVEHFDASNRDVPAVTVDGMVAVIRPSSYDVTKQVVFVNAAECIWVL